ncbi:hypothetical protein PG994_002063 [Apiospora phragmitis]|uniref:DUF2470 domain-containing protein n=1 Tax=Apiospora phragmitis TaxID=2905665 RepID=A0ABR1WVA1_9PEZI
MGGPAKGDAAIKARIMSHMNSDHAAELEHYLRAFNGLSASAAAKAQLVDMATDKLVIQTPSSGETHTVAVDPPMTSLSESRARLVDMARDALQRLGLSDVRVDRYAPPAGFDCVVFFGVAFYFFCAATVSLVDRGAGTPLWDALDAAIPPALGGAAGYVWLVRAIFVPVLAIHVAEAWWMANTRLERHRVPAFSGVWCLWVASVFFEGVPAFRRIDRLVAAERAKKEAQKH